MARPGTEVSVNILGRGTRNARVIRKISDDVVEVDFIASNGVVGTEFVNIHYLGRPVANLPIPAARAGAPVAGQAVSLKGVPGLEGVRNARVVRQHGTGNAVDVDYFTPEGLINTVRVNVNSIGKPLANAPIPRARPAPPVFGTPGEIPLQQGLPVSTMIRVGGRGDMATKMLKAMGREARRAWRATRGTMRNARPGQEVSFYHRELGVVNGRVATSAGGRQGRHRLHHLQRKLRSHQHHDDNRSHTTAGQAHSGLDTGPGFPP